jgi:hypothetical protein
MSLVTVAAPWRMAYWAWMLPSSSTSKHWDAVRMAAGLVVSGWLAVALQCNAAIAMSYQCQSNISQSRCSLHHMEAQDQMDIINLCDIIAAVQQHLLCQQLWAQAPAAAAAQLRLLAAPPHRCLLLHRVTAHVPPSAAAPGDPGLYA